MTSATRPAIVAALLSACAPADQGVEGGKDSAATPASLLTAALPLRVLGTEPFWALDIDTSGLRFVTPDDTAGVRYPGRAPGVAGDTTIWTGRNEQSAIEARIWPGRCSDGMSDREYPYFARVTRDETRYEGCADRRAVISPS